MSKLQTAKNVTTVVTGIGASTIVAQAIKNNTQPTNLFQKVTMTLGAVAMTGIAADAASKYAGAKFDEFVAAYKQIDAQIKENQNK
jgi:hypothetical protein